MACQSVMQANGGSQSNVGHRWVMRVPGFSYTTWTPTLERRWSRSFGKPKVAGLRHQSISVSLLISLSPSSLSLSLSLSQYLSLSLCLSLSLSPLAATPAYRRASSGFGLSCQSLSPNNVVRPAVAWGLEQDRIDVLVCLSTRLNLLWIVGSMPSCSCGLRVAVLVSRFLQGSQVYAGGRVA